MRIRMQAHIANRTRLAGLQIKNRSVHHGHERLGHIVRERAQSRPEPRRQNQDIQGIVFHCLKCRKIKKMYIQNCEKTQPK